MTGVAYVLGQLIGLALIPAGIIWALRGTRPGRVVWRETAKLVRLPAQRRAHAQALQRHQTFAQWRYSLCWWAREQAAFPAGHPQHEAARDMVRYFELHQPEPCYCTTCYLPGTAPRSTR